MRVRHIILVASILAFGCVSAEAQQTTGIPGSPDATTTIDGRYVPPPPQPFLGRIELNAMQSKSAWPARVVPPKGAPNVLLILLDDAGYGANSTFGGVIPTPTLEKSLPTACVTPTSIPPRCARPRVGRYSRGATTIRSASA
jgi:arylsulfatase